MSASEAPVSWAASPRVPGWVLVDEECDGRYWAYWNGLRWDRVMWQPRFGSTEFVDLDGKPATTVDEGIALFEHRRADARYAARERESRAGAWAAGVGIGIVVVILLTVVLLMTMANALINGFNDGL